MDAGEEKRKQPPAKLLAFLGKRRSSAGSGEPQSPGPGQRSSLQEQDFLESASDIICPVTKRVLVVPYLTECCGSHVALEALDGSCKAGEKKPCPVCGEPGVKVMLDKSFQRRVNEMKVRCSNKQPGCKWVGEASALATHLADDCRYATVACQHSCGVRVQRRLMEEHASQHCPKRPYTCTYCNYKGTYKEVTKSHWPVCKSYSLPCPNGCSVLVQPSQLQEHLRECPNQEAECPLRHAGCPSKSKRRNMQTHMEEATQTHLLLVSELSKDVPLLTSEVEKLKGVVGQQAESIKSLEAQVKALATLCLHTPAPSVPVFIPPPAFVIPDRGRLLQEGGEWWSPPFYSHVGGRKLFLLASAAGPRLAVSARLAEGEPPAVEGVVTFNLLGPGAEELCRGVACGIERAGCQLELKGDSHGALVIEICAVKIENNN